MSRLVWNWAWRITATLIVCAITTVVFSVANGLPNNAENELGSDVGGLGCIFLLWGLAAIWAGDGWGRVIGVIGGMFFGFVALVGVLIWLSQGIHIQITGGQ